MHAKAFKTHAQKIVHKKNEQGEERLGTVTEDDAIVMLHFVSLCRCTKSTGDNEEDIKKKLK